MYLYKLDENKNIRMWWTEIEGNKYRSHSGVIDGKITISEWKYAEGKNTGKTNETTPEQQARIEVDSKYVYQLYQGKYHETIEDAKKNKPKFFQPMLAHVFDEEDDIFPAYSQPKLNGIRCIATKDGLFSRRGKPLVATPHVHTALTGYFAKYPDAIVDGELYVHSQDENFNEIISLTRKTKPSLLDLEQATVIEYHVYDLPSNQSFEDRFADKDVEEEFRLLVDQKAIKWTETTLVSSLQEATELFGKYMAAKYEGQMLRSRKGEYQQKRSKFLLKRKTFLDGEYKILDICEGQGNWAGYAKSAIIELPGGSTQNSAIAGTQEEMKKLLLEKDKYINGDGTIKYQSVTPDGKLLFPVMIAYYEGKRDI